MRAHLLALALAFALLAAAGCSSSGDSPASAPIVAADAAGQRDGCGVGNLADAGDANAGASDARADREADALPPAMRPVFPKEVSGGGTVMTSPRIVPITYDGDPFRQNIETFIPKLGASKFWHDVTAEYGVGPAVSGRPVHLSGPAPTTIDDTAVKQWITSVLDGTHPEFDPLNDETMYAIYYPPGTTYTLGGWTGCVEFGASDNLATMPDGRPVSYIVLPRCPAAQGLDQWNLLSDYSSHEFYEEATDPRKDAWATVDAPHMAWALTPPFSEIGDMCVADAAQFIVPADIGSTVQRAWSNAAASAGHNPCVPAPDATPYFVATPVMPDVVPISSTLEQWSGTTQGVHVPVGQARTIEVDLWSDAPVPPWRVRAYDLAYLQGGAPELSLSLDRAQGQSGDRLQLTITALKAGTDGGSRFVVYSDDGVHDGFWFGYVAN
jgi:hypothetical protein